MNPSTQISPFEQLVSNAAFCASVERSACTPELADIAQQEGIVCGKTTLYKARKSLRKNPKAAQETVASTGRVRILVSNAADFDSLGEPDAKTPQPRETTIGGIRVTARHQPDEIDPIALGNTIFDRFQSASTEYLGSRHERPQDYVEYGIETQKPILLVHFGDLHLGNKGTDHKRARYHAELIRDTPGAFAIFGGDGVDNFIKHQSAMISSTSTPREQYSALEYWLSIFGTEKLLGGISGNHDFWTANFAGVDYLRDLFRRLKVPYVPHRLRLALQVGSVRYNIELRHSYRFKSSLNLSNGLQRMWEHSDWEWDLGLLCHTHDGPFMFPFQRHGKTRWGGLCGSYKVHDDYGQQWGWNDAKADSTAFLLDPKTHDVTGFDSVEKGVAHLRMLLK